MNLYNDIQRIVSESGFLTPDGVIAAWCAISFATGVFSVFIVRSGLALLVNLIRWLRSRRTIR